MRKFKFLLPLLAVPLLSVFSCGGNTNTDPYKDKTIKEGSNIKLVGSIKKEYQAGEKLDLGSLKVYYPTTASDPLKYLDPSSSTLNFNEYFITLSNEAPTQNRFTSTTAFNTNKRSETRSVYVAFRTSDDKIHVSDGISVTVTNKNVVNPVLYFVGGAVIIVGVAAIVVFTRKYKQTH